MTAMLPEGDTTETDSGMGNLYADNANERLVQLFDYENVGDDEYKVYVYRWDDEQGEVTKTEEIWQYDAVRAMVERDTSEYLSGHNYGIQYGPAGAWTKKQFNCPECGKFLQPGTPEYHQDSFAPGLVCPDYDGYSSRTTCEGHLTYPEMHDQGGYVTAEEYVAQKWGSPTVEA